MSKYYLEFYNNLVKLSRNKDLYKDFKASDEFSDRLIFFLIHFAFFFKIFKNEDNRVTLQEIYDFTFRQLELSIREIGYGDQSINKKMKDYLNLFHKMIDQFHFWDDYDYNKKNEELGKFIKKSENTSNLLEYFEDYLSMLKKKHFKFLFKKCN